MATNLDAPLLSPLGTQQERTKPKSQPKYRTTPRRWAVLLAFCVLSMTNAILWIGFSAISGRVEDYYNVSSSYVNALSVVFFGLYIPGSVAAAVVIEKGGLRPVLLIGGFLNVLGCVIRCLSVVDFSKFNKLPHNQASESRFYILLIGQLFPAFAQPFFTNVPALLARGWFGVEDRDTAVVLGSASNLIGVALGQALPVVIVTKTHGIPEFLTGELVLSFIALVLCFVCVTTSLPAVPPTRSAAISLFHHNHLLEENDTSSESDSNENNNNNNSAGQKNAAGGSSGPANHPSFDAEANAKDQTSQGNENHQTQSSALPRDHHHHHPPSFFKIVMKSIVICLKDKDFVVLMLCFGCGLGLFSAFATLIADIVGPAGYGDNDAGMFGGALIGAGLVSCVVVGLIMDHTHAYNKILKVLFVVSCGALVFAYLSLRPNNQVCLALALALSGACLIPVLPVSFECGAECTFPVSEDISGGLLLSSGQIFGIVFVYVLDALIKLTPHYHTVFVAHAFFVVGVCFCLAFTSLFYNGPYKRLAADRGNTQQDLLQHD